jgi:hypothetical protein
MTADWIKKLPTSSMSSLLETLLLQSYLLIDEEFVESGYWKLNKWLMQKIRKTNNQILLAKTKDEAVMAEAQVRLLKEVQQQVSTLAKKNAAKCLLHGEFYATAYLDGEMLIVPSRAWSGNIDWDAEKVVLAHKEYSHVRIISHARLTEDQLDLVKQYAAGDVDVQRADDRTPGRPSNMHLIEQKLRQRLTAREMEKSLTKESEVLVEWFKVNHPDKKPPTAKAVENKMRSLYRELKSKSK